MMTIISLLELNFHVVTSRLITVSVNSSNLATFIMPLMEIVVKNF
jgi:hypothetical protein